MKKDNKSLAVTGWSSKFSFINFKTTIDNLRLKSGCRNPEFEENMAGIVYK